VTFKTGVPKKLKLCEVSLCLIVETMANKYTKYKDISRTCYACGSNKTATKITGLPKWNFNLDKNGNLLNILCKSCYDSIISRPTLKAIRRYKETISFKGKIIYHKQNPRKGVCTECGKTGYTHLHHDQYDESDILALTRELCPSCHARESWRLGQMVVTKTKTRKGEVSR
jgi:hypothetical protein